MAQCINCNDAEQSGRHGAMCSGECLHEYRSGVHPDYERPTGVGYRYDYVEGRVVRK